MIRLKTIGIFLLLLVVGISCSSLKKAQRKARKADRLLKEAAILAPSIMDTTTIVKRDTVVLTRDSIVVRTNIELDTTKVDSLILEIINLKAKGEPEIKIRRIKQKIYEQIIPKIDYKVKDSLLIDLEGKAKYLPFEVHIKLDSLDLQVTTKPLENLIYTSETNNISIDARKKGRWWKGFMWGNLSMVILLLLAWIFRGTLTAFIKSRLP